MIKHLQRASANSRFASSQRETALLCNISRWLGTNGSGKTWLVLCTILAMLNRCTALCEGKMRNVCGECYIWFRVCRWHAACCNDDLLNNIMQIFTHNNIQVRDTTAFPLPWNILYPWRRHNLLEKYVMPYIGKTNVCFPTMADYNVYHL